jgi:hypothetical protein
MDYKNAYFKHEIEPALKNCSTAEDMLEVLLKGYDLNEPLKTMTHLAFRQGLRTAITMLNPEPKDNVPDPY